MTCEPQFLVVGHVAEDRTPQGPRIGGTAAYAALTALRMGSTVAVVTSVGPDLDPEAELSGIRVHVVPSAESTVFVNDYGPGGRIQTVKGVATTIKATDIPPDLRSATAVLLGPLVGEVDAGVPEVFQGSAVMASLQGWLRAWDERGRVRAVSWDGTGLLPQVDAAIVSTDDVLEQALIESWSEMVPALIVTEGSRGARIHVDGRWHRVEPFRSSQVDPTGAGDVFAASYLLRFCETGDPLVSARFASCAAGLSIEAVGVQGIPTRSQVEDRLNCGA
jgi:sugar/nucleoside kinase (ribokinase family)